MVAKQGFGNVERQRHPASGYDSMRAIHEAAHAVVIDELGYRVTRINIKPTFPQKTDADWGEFGEALKNIDWDDAAQRDAIRPAILCYVTMLVAGHVAENLINDEVECISIRIQNTPQLLQKPPNAKKAVSDRDRTALYLYLVQRNKIEEVVAAEQCALKILKRREVNLNAIMELLVEHGTIEGEILDDALGKAASDVGQA